MHKPTSLQTVALHNTIKNLVKAQSELSDDIKKYRDLHDRVEVHSIVILSWLISLSSVVIIIIVGAVVLRAMKQFRCCTATSREYASATRPSELNRDDSNRPG